MRPPSTAQHTRQFRILFISSLIFITFLLLLNRTADEVPFIPRLPIRDSVTEKNVKEYEVWSKGCKSLLIDLGANRGDTILRWLTKDTYSGRSKTSIIDQFYSFEQRKKFCVLSFEPNRKFESVLLLIERKMSELAFRVKVKPQTAVSDRFGKSKIYVDDVSTHSYGTSLMPDKKVNFQGKYHALGKAQEVKLVDLASIIKVIPQYTEIVIKMDIEGGEYDVLRTLILSGVACNLKVLIIEYHLHKLQEGTVPEGANEVIEWMLKSNRCGVRVIHDD